MYHCTQEIQHLNKAETPPTSFPSPSKYHVQLVLILTICVYVVYKI